MKKHISNVGSSSRTPFKHWLLNLLLGRDVGVLTSCPHKVPAKPFPYHLIIDMCAGDGYQSADSGESSPSIILRHAGFECRGQSIQTKAVFLEKINQTFELLSDFVGSHPTPLNTDISLIKCDSKDYVLPIMRSNQAVFIHCDPNVVSQIPLTDTFMRALPVTTTMLVTLGCNPGGSKRGPLESRLAWFEHTNLLIRSLSAYHDLIFVSLVGDKSQWSYALRVPLKWVAEDMKTIFNKSEKSDLIDYDLHVVSYRNDGEEFTDAVRQRFLTKKEYQQLLDGTLQTESGEVVDYV